ncbi:amidohydrolase [Cryptosporangium sp. NPDC051539]|uniref:amidohydrolase n=1 Tax=Cryptosporangium sp. NPDC051539 TaxID=3363962 RepID=UPI0037B4C828
MATLYRNGEIYSPADPFATALLVDGDRVLFVGSDDAADAAAFGADEVVDLEGALVAPGFVDAHVHATQTGLTLVGLDLAGLPTLTAALDALAAFASTHPGAILGHGWDETAWPEGRAPSVRELERAAGAGRLVYLSRVDVHSAVASAGLRSFVPDLAGRAGFSDDGPLKRDAHHAVRMVALSAISAAQRAEAQRATRSHAAARGIVALHECGGPDIGGEDDFTGLLALAAAEPGPDVFGYWGEWRSAAKALELGAVGAGGDLFVDGALGSHTAALSAPYADLDTSGHLYLDADQIAEHVVDCVRHDTQAGFHAIGDAALTAVADGLSQAAGVVGLDRVRVGRHRIEHAAMLDSALIKALVNHGVVASMQPAFDALWGGPSGMYVRRLGASRAAELNQFAALAGVGVPLAFGSDAPVTPLDPWGTLRAAAFPHDPRHAISVRAAFAAHTRGGWRALGRDDGGLLVPGAVASFAVWDVAELVVQAPDDRLARWSTDPRAGVHGLPALSEDAIPPRCVRTVVRGVPVFVDPATRR